MDHKLGNTDLSYVFNYDTSALNTILQYCGRNIVCKKISTVDAGYKNIVGNCI